MVKNPGGRPPAPLLRREKKPFMPPVSAALGMAASYYGYPLLASLPRGRLLVLALLFFLASLVCFLRVLRYPLGERFFGEGVRFVSRASLLAVALAAGFSLGIGARQTVRDLPEMGLPEEKIIAVSGILLEDPRSLAGGSGFGLLSLRSCSGQGGVRATARGSIAVFFPAESIPRLKEFGRGSEIYADGVYTARGRSGPLFSADSVHVVQPAPALDQFRTGLRTTLLEKFQARGNRQAAPVWGAFASALLLGMRDDLSVDLSEGFRNSGCTHILALSGMHLAIISGVLAFLIRRPLGVRGASLVGAAFVVFYVFVAGSQPSLVRSAIMYLMGTLGVWGYLKGRPISLLAMAFIIQLLFQSGTGTSLSFILSYLALCGILTLGESIRAIFRGRLPGILASGLSASLGAFILTAPVVVFYFGSLRPVGILAGLVIAPLSSVFIVLALASLAAGFLPFPLWDLLDLVLTWLYRLLEFIVSLSAQVPGAAFSRPVPVLVFSGLLWLLVLYIQKRDFAKRDSVASFD